MQLDAVSALMRRSICSGDASRGVANDFHDVVNDAAEKWLGHIFHRTHGLCMPS